MNKTLYVRPEDEKIWASLAKYADDENRGIGFIVCRLWEKQPEAEASKK